MAEHTKFKIKSAMPEFIVIVITVLSFAAFRNTGFSSLSTSSTLMLSETHAHTQAKKRRGNEKVKRHVIRILGLAYTENTLA